MDALGVVYDTTYERSLLNRVVTGVRKAGDTAIVSILTLDTTSLGTRFHISIGQVIRLIF
ncbi:hypothetical protein LWM68_08815 [Niabella sp. W65]|nr:hypothetical protein [Niabella sp. W65]MCH7362864.1 hypothetical protein [Niabella sp. W65]